MDEYDCKAYPHMTLIDCDASYDSDSCLDIEFDYTIVCVPSNEMIPNLSSSETKCYVFSYVSEDKVIHRDTIISWLSEVGVPEEAFNMVAEDILQCVSEMGNGICKDSRGLSIRVDLSVSRGCKEEEEDEETNCLDENEEEVEVKVEEDEDNALVHPVTRTIEDSHDNDEWKYRWDEEEMEIEEQEDNELTPTDTRSAEDDHGENDYGDERNSYWEEDMEIEEDNTSVIELEIDRDNRSVIELEIDRDNRSVIELEIGRDNRSVIELEIGRDNRSVIELEIGRDNRSVIELEIGRDNRSVIELEIGRDNRSVIELESNGDNRSVIEVESDEDEWNYDWEEMIGIEEDIRFIPAAKSGIEGLKMVTVEEAGKCPICFEDFNVGVCMPCSHTFHMDCIQDWLNVGNSCPLCRFQLPTSSTDE
ncbi:unnamed protein product [Vicia faba]|uniref:RING-type E3 ubiquitin transferase n=1 Tax=Vicia faba TaxID=3906 RepID=A0AAV0ZID8_VICFA|nr:unnamed protein product [Vicia faba]